MITLIALILGLAGVFSSLTTLQIICLYILTLLLDGVINS